MADAGKIIPIHRGSWTSGTDYEVLDQVYYSGSTYIAKNNISNSSIYPNVDTTNWILSARGFESDTLSGITGVDTEGLLGSAGETVVTQALIDKISDIVSTKLIPYTNLVNNGETATSGQYALDANYGKILTDDVNEIKAKINNIVNNVKDYGAIGDGITDDTTAILNAIADGGIIYFPTGIYRITQTIHITTAGITLVGDGYTPIIDPAEDDRTGTVIYADFVGSCIEIDRVAWHTIVKDIRLNRPETDSSTNYGIMVHNWCWHYLLENIYVSNFHYGFYLGASAISRIVNCHAVRNFGHGFLFNNAIDDNRNGRAMQVDVISCMAQQNNGSGFVYQNQQESGSMPIGAFSNNKTFVNNGYGIAFLGTQDHNITAIRMDSCFVGNDGHSGLYMDHVGYPSTIVNCQFEAPATSATGRNLETAATTNAYNVEIVDSAMMSFTGCMFATAPLSAVRCASNYVTIDGCLFWHNGTANTSHGGIYCGANTQFLTVNSCQFAEDNFCIHFSFEGKNIVTSNNFYASANSITGTTTYVQTANNIDPA